MFFILKIRVEDGTTHFAMEASDPVISEELKEREICNLPEAVMSYFSFLAPFGQAVKLQTTDPGIFFRGRSDFVDMLRSQMVSLPEPVYPWKLET
jgi:hypothetical protein